jgi:hypothetical protein
MNRISGGGNVSFNDEPVFSQQPFAKNGAGASFSYPCEDDKARGKDPSDLEYKKIKEEIVLPQAITKLQKCRHSKARNIL